MARAKKINFQYKIADKINALTIVVLTEEWDTTNNVGKQELLLEAAIEDILENHFELIVSSISEDK